MTPSRPRLTRRETLALIATAVAGLVLPAGVMAAADAPGAPTDSAAAASGADAAWSEPLQASFSAFCDTLVPADALSPAASSLGVPARVLAQGGGSELFRRLVGVSVGWLDQQAGGDFSRVYPEHQDAILKTMSELPWEAPQRRFFDLMRELVMGFYWSQPAAWKGLATEHPPQPGGYFEAVQ